jgi:4-diphosphocytidyl-2-C-methyl-D-erythritol kinase
VTVLFETAYAKINLALHIRGHRLDSYHELDTLFAFVNSGDELSAEDSPSISLSVTGPFAEGLSDGGDNLVLRAARHIQTSYGITKGAAITLNKRLPVASGIGGGSADAAAISRLLNRLWGINASHYELAKLLAPLGADIPACVASILVRGQGIGTELTPFEDATLQDSPVLLVNPLKPVATGSIFAAWDGVDKGALSGKSALNIALSGRNDLQAPALKLCPEIGDVLTSLRQQDPILTRMSGSGATCFALFSNCHARDEAARIIEHNKPGWWTLKGLLR